MSDLTFFDMKCLSWTITPMNRKLLSPAFHFEGILLAVKRLSVLLHHLSLFSSAAGKVHVCARVCASLTTVCLVGAQLAVAYCITLDSIVGAGVILWQRLIFTDGIIVVTMEDRYCCHSGAITNCC